MKKRKSALSMWITTLILMLLILDAKFSSKFAYDGVQLCLKTLIPSLFPLLFLSVYMNQTLLDIHIPGLSLLGKICKMPSGSEPVLLLGLLGGYPVGAQMISQCYQNHTLTLRSAKRLSGFCSNAGPAFIFGVAGLLFHSSAIPWYLWGIQILSAILVGMLLPDGDTKPFHSADSNTGTLPEALKKSVGIMAGICGWVIVFRVLIGMCQRWFLWFFPDTLQLLFSGFLELSNGILALDLLNSEAERFLFASCFLSTGGLCVFMQTATALSDLGCRTYLLGKTIQTGFSFLLSYVLQFFIFSSPVTVNSMIFCLILLTTCCIIPFLFGYHFKKSVAIA